MTQGQQDRPEGEEPEDSQSEAVESEQESTSTDTEYGNYVPGSAADPSMQGASDMRSEAYYGPVSDADERNWSMLTHLSGFAGFLFPFANIIAPLIVWLLFRARSDMVDYHGKRAINFQISMTIWAVIAALFSFVLIGIPFLIGLLFVSIIWMILAAVRASRGDPPGYILTIGFLK